MDAHFGLFQFIGIIVLLPLTFCRYLLVAMCMPSIRYIPRSRISSSEIYNLYSYQQIRRTPMAPLPSQHMVLSVCLIWQSSECVVSSYCFSFHYWSFLFLLVFIITWLIISVIGQIFTCVLTIWNFSFVKDLFKFLLFFN